MANLVTGAGFAVRMDMLDITALWDGTATERSSTKLTIDIGDGYVEHFTGTGVSYDANGNPLSGTITGLQETFLGATSWSLTGLNTSAVTFNGWVHNADTLGALASMMGGDDNLTGGAFNDVMAGMGGHDNLYGGAGADTLFGNDGNDHLYGQSANGGTDGADSISGGNGMDYIQGNAGNDTLDGGNGNDRINGGADNDNITGGDGNDSVNGNLGNDTIDGGGGSDTLRGGKGDDLITGGDGYDVLMGDVGNDTLEGGHHGDRMTGGDGADVFRFNRAAGSENDIFSAGTYEDVVTDYSHGTDHIQLDFIPSAILTGSSSDLTHAMLDAADLMRAHAGYGEVVLMQVGGDTYLMASGAGLSNFVELAIRLDGVTASTITAADFV